MSHHLMKVITEGKTKPLIATLASTTSTDTTPTQNPPQNMTDCDK